MATATAVMGVLHRDGGAAVRAKTWRMAAVLAPMLAVLLSLFAVPTARAGDDHDRWYVLDLMGSRSGYMRSVRNTAEGKVTTRSDTVMRVKRGNLNMVISMSSEFIETEAGEPVSMKSVQEMAGGKVVQEFVFKEDGVEQTVTQSGTVTTKTLPRPEGQWLPPAAAERYFDQRRKSEAKEIAVRSMDPTTGLAILTTTHALNGKETRKVRGEELELTSWTVNVSHMPGMASKEFIDAEGTTVLTETNVGGMPIVMMLSTKEEALKDAEAPEIMVATFVKPEGKKIENPRETTSAVYLLSIPDGEMPALPVTGSQSVAAQGPLEVRVTIDTSFPNAAPAADKDNAAFLAATVSADAKDERIVELTTRALQHAPEGKAERAEALRRYVFRYIRKKTLGVGFATATEVARTREGDCSEHAVLLAAMLRADGIPSRVASGLLFADAFAGQQEIFGYHMWAQALLEVDGRLVWVDLDGTLPPAHKTDATHITLAVSDMADNEIGGGMITMVSLLGRLRITVESVK